MASWQNAVKAIRPYVVKIETPRGSGTGFLCAYSKEYNFFAIATALHVVEESHNWEEPIRIRHYESKQTKLLHASERVIFRNYKLDTAAIIFTENKIPFPEKQLKFIAKAKHLLVGVEIGWVGFPSVSPQKLCFFAGVNSCYLGKKENSYLVDGVAINGVSGGPAFYIVKNGIKIVGSVSAYLPNRVGATPGLALISGVEQFLKVIKELKSLGDAKKKEDDSSNESKNEKTDKDLGDTILN